MSQPPMNHGQPPMGYPQQPMGYPQQGMQPQQKKGLSTGCIVLIVLAALGVPIVVVMAALAVYGVRRYLASSKTAEAKTSVGAIARGATAAFEREVPLEGGAGGHKLCASKGPDAPGHGPVPRRVPSGQKYMPASSEGEDYNTGGPSGGWKCLRFDMGRPQYYQYHYNAGGDYVTDNPNLPRGEGFEAAAKGDIDGDGTESSFSTVGKIEGTTLSRSYDVFLEDEFE